MHAFIREQKAFKVGDVVFGGQPGQHPTVLFGTLFYGTEFKTIDDVSLKKARDYFEVQENLSDETGVPGLVDVYIRSPGDIQPEIDAVLSMTDAPFSIDSSEAKTRALALEYLSRQGCLDKVIYNSINLGVTSDEIKMLEKHTPECAIALAYNPRDMGVEGRMNILLDGGGMLCVPGGILDIAEGAGIKKIILDTGATPFGSMGCETLRAIPVFKNKFGLPTGCSIHNTLESWPWMRDYRKKNQKAYDCVNASANSLVPICCGDFIVYGPISSAPDIFPSIAFTDKLVGEGAKDYFGVKTSDNHPLKRL
jgi:tetrahydromethanopterin S-methyltransferase subunit H